MQNSIESNYIEQITKMFRPNPRAGPQFFPIPITRNSIISRYYTVYLKLFNLPKDDINLIQSASDFLLLRLRNQKDLMDFNSHASRLADEYINHYDVNLFSLANLFDRGFLFSFELFNEKVLFDKNISVEIDYYKQKIIPKSQEIINDIIKSLKNDDGVIDNFLDITHNYSVPHFIDCYSNIEDRELVSIKVKQIVLLSKILSEIKSSIIHSYTFSQSLEIVERLCDKIERFGLAESLIKCRNSEERYRGLKVYVMLDTFFSELIKRMRKADKSLSDLKQFKDCYFTKWIEDYSTEDKIFKTKIKTETIEVGCIDILSGDNFSIEIVEDQSSAVKVAYLCYFQNWKYNVHRDCSMNEKRGKTIKDVYVLVSEIVLGHKKFGFDEDLIKMLKWLQT